MANFALDGESSFLLSAEGICTKDGLFAEVVVQVAQLATLSAKDRAHLCESGDTTMICCASIVLSDVRSGLDVCISTSMLSACRSCMVL